MLWIWIQFTNLTISAIILIVWGTIVFIRIPAQFNFISATIPTKDLTTAHSLLQLSFVIPKFLGAMTIAFIGDLFTTSEIFFYFSIIFALTAMWRAFSPSTKMYWKYNYNQIERELID